VAERMGGAFSHCLRRLIGRRNENKNKIRCDLRRRPATENTQQSTKNTPVMNVSKDVYKVDAYPDADFAGMYGHKNHTDPACAKCRTRFIITFADCPV
jgi:hypothetical protein